LGFGKLIIGVIYVLRSLKAKWKANTYVKRFLEHNPTGFGLDFKVFQIVGIEGGSQAVYYSSIVVGIFIGGGDTEDIGANTGILFYILNVFLQKVWFKYFILEVEIDI